MLLRQVALTESTCRRRTENLHLPKTFTLSNRRRPGSNWTGGGQKDPISFKGLACTFAACGCDAKETHSRCLLSLLVALQWRSKIRRGVVRVLYDRPFRANSQTSSGTADLEAPQRAWLLCRRVSRRVAWRTAVAQRKGREACKSADAPPLLGGEQRKRGTHEEERLRAGRTVVWTIRRTRALKLLQLG